jgi:CelD/BcsL family acetyltransferase involved in cellulose biosynthesis
MAGNGTERIALTVGRRRLLTMELRMAKVSFSLEDILDGREPDKPSLAMTDGVRVRSLPIERRDELLAHYPGLIFGMVRRYRRHYIAMEGTFDSYFGHFSRKTRSTLRRKRRRFAEVNGGKIDVREYRGVSGLEEFLRLALPLSARTYQGRLLKKGLPGDPASRQAMLALAAEDRVRAFLLFHHGRPAAYLYLPVDGRTLVYAHLGYEPRVASLSPGTVLQLEALERLFVEGKFAYFDFTEGEGQQKALFATDSISCESLVLLRPSLSNRARLAAHDGFYAMVRQAKAVARGLSGNPGLRSLLSQ